jgi:CheY-like chemotaxis protein
MVVWTTREGVMLAAPFDVRRRRFTGKPVAVLEGVASEGGAAKIGLGTGIAVRVEGGQQLAKLLRTIFSIEGFETRTGAHRAEIVEALRKPPVPDLVLLDVGLPDADGFEILGKLRHHPAFKSTAIVMLTGKATREAVLRGLAGGADGYITKPFEVEVLMRGGHHNPPCNA